MSDELTEEDAGASTDASDEARVYLIVRQKGGSQVVELPRDGEATIGRGGDATIPIDDSKASRRHACLRRRGPALVLEDLGSRNGTRVNNQLVRAGERPLRGGDCIRIGASEIAVAVVSAGAPEGRAPPPAAAEDIPEGVIVADPSMARVFGFARRVARASTTVLILGETGVGKEVVARQVHVWSARAAGPFVRVNCAALPEPIVESELFGYERGAFTGADRRKTGLVEAASTGTLFLDEIGELPLPIQAKLLSVLENRVVLRLGSTVETPVDVRVVCATHRDLPAEVAAGRFRDDLYYRISPVILRVPPLRERPTEIALLAELFARRLGEKAGWPAPVVHRSTLAALLSHGWPGNVRELRNAMEHALLVTDDGTIRAEHLPETIGPARAPAARPSGPRGVKAALAEVERASIEEALRATGGNRTRAAQQLGISLRSLLYKIEKYRSK